MEVLLAPHLSRLLFGDKTRFRCWVVAPVRVLDNLLVRELGVLLAIRALVHVNDHSATQTQIVLESDLGVDVAIVGPAYERISLA